MEVSNSFRDGLIVPAPEYQNKSQITYHEGDALDNSRNLDPVNKLTSRLLIHKMKLTNFKSFKGTTEIGPFNTNFTSIIGPNGSGKSNTLDAIQFIFSKNSSSLRAKKLSELIYNSRGQKADFCKVEIIFWVVPADFRDNTAITKTSEVIEEFVIGRHVSKSSTSTYYINGQKTSTKEVVSLLKNHNVDLDNNRFLILQGEVESIATKNSLKLMDYMEEVIGTYKYKEPIEQLAQSLEKYREEAAAKLTDAVNLEKILDKSRDRFQQSLLAARDRLEIAHCTKELSIQTMKYYDFERQRLEKEVDNRKNEMRTINEKIERSQEIMKENEEYISKKRETLNRNKEMLEGQKKEETTLNKELNTITHDIKAKKSKIEKNTKLLQTSEGQIEMLNKDVEKNKQNISKLEMKLEEADKALTISQESLNIKMKEIEGRLKPIHLAMDKVNKKLSPYKMKLQEMLVQLEQDSGKLSSLKSKITSHKDDVVKLQENINNLNESISLLSDELEGFERDFSNNAREKTQLNERILDFEKQLRDLLQERNSIEQRLHRLKSESTVAKTGKLVYKKVVEGNFPGFHDRVGNLATIDKKYNAAISSVFHISHNLVVEDIETFRKIVPFLTSKKLHASFENLKVVTETYGNRAFAKFNAPPDAPRLYDLLNIPDKKYKPIFYKALRDILVASNLKRGRELAYGSTRMRVVTLMGEIIDPSGSMTSSGGNRTLVLGNSAPTVSKDALDAMEVKYQELTQKVSEINNVLKELRQKLDSFTKENANLKINVEISKNKLSAAQTSKVKREEELSIVKKELKALQRQSVSNLEEQIAKLEKNIDHFQNESKSLTEELHDLESQEKSAKGTECAELEHKVKQLENEVSDLHKSRAKSIQTIKSSKKKIEKLRTDTSKAEEEVNQNQADIDSLTVRKSAIIDSLKDIGTSMQVLVERIDSKAEKLKHLEETQERYKIKFDRLKRKHSDQLSAINNLTKEIEGFQVLRREQESARENALHKIEEIKSSIPNIHQPFGEVNVPLDDIDLKIVKLTFESFKMYFRDQSAMEVDNDDAMEDIEEEITEEIYNKNIKKLHKDIEAARKRIEVNEYRGPEFISGFISNKIISIEKRQEANSAVEERESQSLKHQELCEERKSLFLEGFSICDKRMRQIFRSFTQEGDATLQLLDPQNPFEGGILFNVRPPGKSWREIQNLSGGEKTLSSLALVFGMHHYRPTPIYILDEIDAALDFRNVSIIGNYIQEQATNAQFIVISLRNHMFDLADRLIGIYKTEDISKSIVIEASKIEAAISGDNVDEKRESYVKRKRRRTFEAGLNDFQ